MKLIRESKWSRVYEVAPNHQLFESKFQKDGLAVSLEELRGSWKTWTGSEKLDFATAYLSKPEITSEDERILDFLMEQLDERVWMTIAILLPRHSNKKKVLRFLLERLKTSSEPKANFLEGIVALGDPEAIPSLRELHDRLRAEIRVAPPASRRWAIYDFMWCCSALMKFAVEGQYEAEIRSFLNHPDERVQLKAQAVLHGYPTIEGPR